MTCTLCDDSGLVLRGDRAVDCGCRIERRRLQAIARSGIPERYRVKTFEQYDGSLSSSAGAALTMAKAFVREWPTRRDVGVLMTGPVGIGKTHLASSILLECSRQWGARVAFVDLPDLFTQIKATFDPAWSVTEYEILKPILSADVLAIDEVGAARSTDWAFAMTSQIINARYNQARSTIITTNFPNRPEGWTPAKAELTRSKLVAVDDYAARMTAPVASAIRRETLGDRIGTPMYSRVQEMCVAIEMDGQDQRAARRRG